jgi:hypothetical protein
VRVGRYGPALAAEPAPTPEQWRDPEIRRAHGERARLHMALHERVEAILGPQSEARDPIVRSRTATGFGQMYLARLPRNT